MKLVPPIALVLVACGGAAVAPLEVPVAGGGSASASATAQASAAPPANSACPPTFGGGPIPACDRGEDPGLCVYAEGTCSCGVPVHCGGAAPPPMPPQWTCERPREPCPADGTPCRGGETCHDGACAWGRVHECHQGKWRSVEMPPPP